MSTFFNFFYLLQGCDFRIFRPLRDDPCDSRRSKLIFLRRGGGGGGGMVGYCMMSEITQMALSYYLNKLQKDCFLKHHGRNDLRALHGLAAPSARQLKENLTELTPITVAFSFNDRISFLGELSL